jgi:hypothetical protein
MGRNCSNKEEAAIKTRNCRYKEETAVMFVTGVSCL